jgi:general secretion pathway protein G
MSTNRKTRRGFTLIEAIVVIVIIGILATVIGPPLYRNVFRGRKAAAEANAATIAQAVESYRLDYSSMPESLNALLVKANDGKGVGSPYLQNSDQLIDPWGNSFKLVVPGVKNPDFDIVSYGADGKQGGTGDDADIVKP